jgi:hypothetical protein
MTGRPKSGDTLGALRGALGSELPELRKAAELLIRAAKHRADTWDQVARNLEVNPRSFERFLHDFPEIREWTALSVWRANNYFLE